MAWLGCEQSGEVFKQPLRVVWVKTGKTDSQGRPEILLLASDLMDVDAAWIALGYKFRWTVELFFRWFKCIPGLPAPVVHLSEWRDDPGLLGR